MKCIGESIVVTGGAGFVGSCLVKTLAEQAGKCRITILDNLCNGHLQYLPDSPCISLQKVDLRSNENANSEDDPYEPTDIYGLSKIVNEMQLKMFSSKVTTQCAAVRLSNVYGPNETNPHVVPEILSQIKQGSDIIALGNVKPKRDYIYV